MARLPIIPMSSPDLTEAERQAVADVINTPNLSMGPKIKAFENAICEFSGSRHAIGVSSGTAGLHLCILAAGVTDRDLVITTPFSFVASSNVILFERGIPVFVDIDQRTGNIDPVQLSDATEALIAGRESARHWLPRQGAKRVRQLKAILPVDVFGQPADLDPIRQIADRYQLKMIEDSCEALGAEYKSRKAGTLGDYGVYAFYPNKQITTGEGGVIVTDDEEAAEFMRALRNQGRVPGDTWLQHTYLGYNYRLDELSAVLGVVQMTRIEELLQNRERVATWYTERLAEIEGVETAQVVSTTTRMSWFVYVIRLAASIDRDAFAKDLAERGIPARPYFLPIHLQPYMTSRFGYRPGDFPVTEDLGRRSLALPFSGVMTEDQVDQICRIIQEVLHV